MDMKFYPELKFINGNKNMFSTKSLNLLSRTLKFVLSTCRLLMRSNSI